jgi:hypothetical protein
VGAPGHLGPYRLLNVIHTGHASQIWQAYDDALGRMVGVKTLRVAADTAMRERFGQEGRRRFSDIFRHERMTAQLRDLYGRVLTLTSCC